jgi:hypothetical protein
MISRYFISINFSILITFGLFYFMFLLINNGGTVFVDTSKEFKVILTDIRPIDPPVVYDQLPPFFETESQPDTIIMEETNTTNVGPSVIITTTGLEDDTPAIF